MAEVEAGGSAVGGAVNGTASSTSSAVAISKNDQYNHERVVQFIGTYKILSLSTARKFQAV